MLRESIGLAGTIPACAVGTDYNNDRAIDLVLTAGTRCPLFSKIRAKANFLLAIRGRGLTCSHRWQSPFSISITTAGWIVAFTHWGAPGITLWRNDHGKNFEPLIFPRRTGLAPGAWPPSTTTMTAGSTWWPWAKPPKAKAKSASSAIWGRTDSKTSPPTSASTRFNSKTRAPLSPPTTTATAPPIC